MLGQVEGAYLQKAYRFVDQKQMICTDVDQPSLILTWRRADPDAVIGHAPAHHPRPLLRGFRMHTLLCHGSGLPLHFLISAAKVHDAPFARHLLTWAVQLYHLRPRVIR